MITALGGAAGTLFVDYLWNALFIVSAALLVWSILHMATGMKAADS